MYLLTPYMETIEENDKEIIYLEIELYYSNYSEVLHLKNYLYLMKHYWYTSLMKSSTLYLDWYLKYYYKSELPQKTTIFSKKES